MALRVIRRWPLATWCVAFALVGSPAESQQCPQPPILLSPANGAVVPGPNVTFTWDDPCAPIPFTSGNLSAAKLPETAAPERYWIQFATNPGFSPLLFENNGGDPSYTWVSPPAGLYYWRVKACQYGPTVCATSVARSFTVPLKVLSPVGGENWPPGSTQTVTWQGGGTIKIELFADVTSQGASLSGPSQILAAAATGGSWSVTMPPNIATRRARIQISRTSGTPMHAFSPNPFYSVTEPMAGVWSYDDVSGSNHGWNQSDMCSNGASGVHAVYFDYLGGSNLMMASKVDKTANWVIELVDDVGAVGSWPSIVRAGDGTLHVAYYDHTIGTAKLYYKRRPPGQAWQARQLVASVGVVQGDCSIALQNNVPYIAYNTGNAGQMQLRLAKQNADGLTWAPFGPVIAAQTPHHITLQSNPFGSNWWLTFIDQGGNRMNLYYWNGFNWFNMVNEGLITFATPGPYTTAEIALDLYYAPYLAYTIRNTTNGGQKLIFQKEEVTQLHFGPPYTIDTSLGTISSLSIEIPGGSQNPRIGYAGNGVVKQAAGDWNGSEYVWTLGAVDATGNMDSQVSLALTSPFDSRWLFYRDVTNTSMRASRPYWVDNVPPAASAYLNSTGGCEKIYLSWQATGDNGNVGTATAYDLRWSFSPITTEAAFNSAVGVPIALPSPGPPGTSEQAEIVMGECSAHKYFALKIRDDVGNLSPLTADPYGSQTACIQPPAMCWEKSQAGDPQLPLATEIASLRPNPTSSAVEVQVALARAEAGAPLDLSVFDVAGRRVASLQNFNPGAGRHLVRWDLRDQSGREVSAGIYFVRLRVAAMTRTQRVVVVR
jgi:hypothetical protein